jgi:hypothetical protein
VRSREVLEDMAASGVPIGDVLAGRRPLRRARYHHGMVLHLSPDYHRQHFAATYVLPVNLGRDLRHRLPVGASLAPAKAALRQWLRLQVLAPEDIEMPSLAVSLLWLEFVRSPDFEHFSAQAYRHVTGRRPSDQVLRRRPAFLNSEGLALTFAMSCIDQGLETPNPAELPALFGADKAVGLDGGPNWVLSCGGYDCRARQGERCTHHEFGPLVPEDLPKEIRFDVPAPYPLDGSSHRLWGPLY